MREADASLGVRLGVTVRDCGPEGCVDGPGLQRETGLRQGPVALISVQPGRQLHAEFQPQVGEPGCWPPPGGGGQVLEGRWIRARHHPRALPTPLHPLEKGTLDSPRVSGSAGRPSISGRARLVCPRPHGLLSKNLQLHPPSGLSFPCGRERNGDSTAGLAYVTSSPICHPADSQSISLGRSLQP